MGHLRLFAFYFSVFALGFCIPCFAFSQQTTSDSLVNSFRNSKDFRDKILTLVRIAADIRYDDNEKAQKITDLAYSFAERSSYTEGMVSSISQKGELYYDMGIYDSTLTHYKKALELSLIDKNDTLIAQSYNNLGTIYDETGDYTPALENYFNALFIYRKLDIQYETATCYSHIGLTYYNKSDLNQAFQYYLMAMKIFETLNDEKGIAKTRQNIGLIYQDQLNYKAALLYFNKALDTYRKIDYKRGMAGVLNNIGIVYFFLNDKDKALDYYQQALVISEAIGSDHISSRLYGNIGLIYKGRGEYELALKNLFRSLEIKEKLGEKKSIANSHNNIGGTYRFMGKYYEAIKHAFICINIAKEISSPDLCATGMLTLSQTYFAMGDFKNAYIYRDSSGTLNDSVYSKESAATIAEMETKYETEKKQQQIEIQQSQLARKDLEASRQRIVTYSFIGGFILMIILATLAYINFRNKKKANIILTEQKLIIEEKNEELKQQNEEIQAQRDEISSQRDLVVSQKKDIEVIHDKLTSSIRYARLIQQAALPTSEFMQQVVPDHFILYKPRDIVSGDFYWVTIKKRFLLAAVGDCTGHGVPGAFMCMLGISALNDIVAQTEDPQPSVLLGKLRENIIRSLKQQSYNIEKTDDTEQNFSLESQGIKDGMDISLIAIDLETNTLHFAGANNPLYIVSSQQSAVDSRDNPCGLMTDDCRLIEIKPDKMPIAVHVSMNPFAQQTYQLEKGDTAYLFSDGYADQFGGRNGKKFMYSNFKKLLTEINDRSMEEQRSVLSKTIESWINSGAILGEQTDDITVLGVRI